MKLQKIVERATTGMTTARWMELPTTVVAISRLIPTQDLDGHLNCAPKLDCIDKVIHVVRWQNYLLVEDGHHRLARALDAGEIIITARILPAR